MPVIKVRELAYGRLRAPDLDVMEEFLTNFGMIRSARTPTALYMRGTDPRHHVHITEKGDPKFVAFGYYAASEDDLARLAKAPGASAVESIDEPGGGKRVRLRERRRQLAGSLSGGQQQMVAIGRGLMAQPRLLLLDEPSLGLAPTIVEEMFGIIRAIHAEGVAILLVEQNVPQALDIADRAYVLEEGRVVAEGLPSILRQQSRIQQAYLGVRDGDDVNR